MSPVNRASSVVEISPGQTGPITEISVFATEISVTEMKIFIYERSSPVTRRHFLDKHWFTFGTQRPQRHNFGFVSISTFIICDLALLA